jgi:cystathionine gamma-synthase
MAPFDASCNMVPREFYNRLDTAKGPGFGSNFTLCCPYTMIAHYNELEWCQKYGVDRSLVRVWIGLEEEEELLRKFEFALEGM